MSAVAHVPTLVKTIIDGVSLQSSRQISRQLDSIDPFNIDRIEVLSGATSIYGAGASGGVINIITKKAQSEELEFESFVGGTSGLNSSEDFDYKVAQSISGGNETVQARSSVVYTETQGVFDSNGTIATPDISQGSLQFNQTVDFLTTVIMLSASYIDEQVLGHQLIAEASYRKEDQTFTPYYQSSGQQITDVVSLKAVLAKNFDKFNIVYGIDAYQDKLESNQALYDSTIANDSGNLVNRTSAQVGRYPGVEVSSG